MRSRPMVLVAVVAVVWGAVSGGWLGRAGAEVSRLAGFSATVDGYRGWFGSYAMAGLGTVWCVDHGIAAPDADYGYVRAELSDRPAPVRTAIAWALGSYGHRPDRVTSAALTLAIHDLMDAPYPSGRLELDRLTRARLAGFEGLEQAVLDRARAIEADALAHAHLRAPFHLSAHAGEVRPGQAGVLVARLVDAAGNGVAGVPLSATGAPAALAPGAQRLTDARGEQRFPFVAAAGENRFQVAGVVADTVLQSFASSTRRAQRVARAGRVPVAAGTGFTATVRRLSVRKTGDASAYLPPAHARFEVRHLGAAGSASAPVAELVTDAEGRSPWLELDRGVYQLMEVAAPAGYRPAGPWTVDLTTRSELVVEARNQARPGTALIAKVDAGTGRSLPGATLALAHDADRDAVFETPLEPTVSGAQADERQLRPGDYELREVVAPSGYRLADRPVRFSVAPDRVTTVTVANERLPAVPATRPPTAQAAPTAPVARRSLVPPATPATVPVATPARGSSRPRRLPDTGQPSSGLVLAGTGLVLAGTLLAGSERRPSRRARRRILARL